MTREELVGYIGTPHGNEASLTAFDAVTRVGAGFRRYPGAGGQPQELSTAEAEYVLPAPNELRSQWRRGHVIWFAGRNFVVRGLANSIVKDALIDWSLTDQGHRMHTGTPRQLRGLRDTVGRDLAAMVSEYLFDPLEKRHNQATEVFELFLGVENTATQRRFLTSALYYFQSRKIEEYEFTRERAALSGTFESQEEFDVRFQRHREWFGTGRAGEMRADELVPSVTGTERRPVAGSARAQAMMTALLVNEQLALVAKLEHLGRPLESSAKRHWYMTFVKQHETIAHRALIGLQHGVGIEFVPSEDIEPLEVEAKWRTTTR